ncbi:MAG: dihydroneopterin aldolase [Pseudomonadota bacterium]
MTTKSARPHRRVFVRDLEIVASVGVYEIEHRYEQRIVVSVDLDVIDEYDGVSETLAHVLDYSKIVEGLEKIAQARHTKLIETLAERMAAFCLSDPRVQVARIRIEKPDIMPSCRAVGIEIERRRG